MICIGISEKDDIFKFEKNCFFKNSMAYYQDVEPGQKVRLQDLIVMVRDHKDPYIKSYQLSLDGVTAFNVNLDNSRS